ncbi:MAG TPA: methionyl-tRNA formyltransferase, partial [Caldimonas sp.]|nr:methionyl-tRNA formyltransferase [Caldimonas sp.]
MRLAFAGTPEFARVALASLCEAGHEVVAVLSQPDRPAGRGLRLQASPVKDFATRAALPVLQPRGLRLDGRFAEDAAAAQSALVGAAPEAIVVAAYGLILPGWLLTLPPRGCINIHASLLPRWRGAAPIQRAIEAGDAETGITLMQMDAGLDTGDILMTASTPIGVDDTGASLQARLARLGAGLAVQGLVAMAGGHLGGRRQPEDGVTYAHKIVKAEAVIDWREPAAAIERRLR